MKYIITVPADVSNDGLAHTDPDMQYELSEFQVNTLREHGIIVTPV